MGQDIGNIESQNKGLQLETANQKSLLVELNVVLVVFRVFLC